MNLSVPARAPVGRVRSTGYGNRIGLAVMLAGIFVTVMDNSIVNVAIPAHRLRVGSPGQTLGSAFTKRSADHVRVLVDILREQSI
jgi:hypothetical protein